MYTEFLYFLTTSKSKFKMDSEEGSRKRFRTTEAEDDKARAVFEATEALLPKSGTTWHVIFQNPDLFLSLIKIASPVLTDRIRFYPTIRRGFTGILIDEFAPSQAALMIGRLCCPVHISSVAEGLSETGEVAVTVPTESLIATLKGTNAIQSVAMYQRSDSANVFFAILDPSSGHVRHDDIPTLCGTAHSTLKALKFQYELTVSVDKFKKDIGHVSAKGIAEVCLRLARVNPELFLLILSGTGERGNTFASLPISSAPTQKRLGGGEEEGEAGSDLVRTVGQLTADSRGRIISDTMSVQGLVPVSKEEIEKLEVCYKASFSVKYLEKMIKSLKDESQMTLFLGDRPTILPLIIRFDLDIKHGIESYAAFVLAANVEETA